jgi:hypothetical protein
MAWLGQRPAGIRRALSAYEMPCTDPCPDHA